MVRTARSRRTTAVLAALSLGVPALTACAGDTGKDKAAPSATASPSAAGKDTGKDKGKGSGTPSTAGPSDGGTGDGGTGGEGSSDGGTPPPSEAGVDDDQDGGVGMCETTDMGFTVTVASQPANHALLTAINNSGDPCALAANEPMITVPGLDGAAQKRGPANEDWMLNPGDKAYAGILFARVGTEGGKSADKVEIALAASESPATVPIGGGPVTVNDGQVTSFFATAEDALTH
ncbi:DUF4232 domain-containing protein [Streptomyces sp. NPDC051207]|uniref:DUF4232 domain-containing protein n=1 Tax=Streptomyces sp. NPDC051207 TaxID=3154641 RepID=UPI003426F390